MKRILILCLLFLSLTCNAQLNIYVDSSATAGGNGASWSSAYTTLNQALNVAINASYGCNIYVAKGTYYATGAQSGTNSNSTFLINRGGIRLYGGYPPGGGVRSMNNNPTILSGDIGTPGNSGDNSTHIMVIGNISAGADSIVVDGFLFTKGVASSPTSNPYLYGPFVIYSSYGSAIYIKNNSTSLLINDCSFIENASWNGGAVNVDSSVAVISNSIFNYNTGGEGAAIAASASAVSVQSCSFDHDTAFYGGAIYCINNQPGGNTTSVTGCSFSNNRASNGFNTGSGGAIYSYSSVPVRIRDCNFQNNSAWDEGGAVYLNCYRGLANVAISTSVFKDNTCGTGGGAAYLFVTNVPVWLDSCSFIHNRTPNFDGGGLYLRHTDSTGDIARVSNSQFVNDSAEYYGGGLYITSGRGLTTAVGMTEVLNCTFTSCISEWGGGMYIEADSCVFDRCNFKHNRASRFGGGLISAVEQALFNRCNFSGNDAEYGGGLVLYYGQHYSISNSLFSGNKAQNGGALGDDCGTGEMINCTFAGDTATVKGNSIFNERDTLFSATNCIFWDGSMNGIRIPGNAPSLSYSIVENNYPGAGNTGDDPVFIHPVTGKFAPDTAGDYHLASCSPAIDAGLNTVPLTNDLDGLLRIYGFGVDKGAYEVHQPATALMTITGTDSLCADHSIQLNHTAPSGAWQSDDTTVARVTTNGLVTGLAQGSAFISYNNTYCPVRKNIKVTKIDTTILSGTFLIALESDAHFQWVRCDHNYAPIPGDTGYVMSPGQNGSYAVIITKSGCVDTSACYTVSGLAVSPINQNPLIIYPNPCTATLMIDNGNDIPDRIIINDLTGREIQNITGLKKVTVADISSMPPGLYFISVYRGIEKQTRAISVVR